MSCLILRLAGPMQSWGIQSRFVERDTSREPTKSGVVGLLCAALGIDREDDAGLQKLASLPMGIRVDHLGTFSRDYHTAGGGTIPGLKTYCVINAQKKLDEKRTILSNRYYLADAEFHAAIESSDTSLLESFETALHSPHWPLYLGRKSFVPTPPLCLGIKEGSIREALQSISWRQRREREEPPTMLRLMRECGPDEGVARMDIPLSFANSRRRFTVRYVIQEFIEDFPIKGWKEETDVSVTVDSQST